MNDVVGKLWDRHLREWRKVCATRDAVENNPRAFTAEESIPTPLEVLLTEHVVAGWLLVEVLEGLIAAQHRRDLKNRRLGPGFLIQQSRILESTTRRYLAAMRELASVRKLQAGAPVHESTEVNVLRG